MYTLINSYYPNISRSWLVARILAGSHITGEEKGSNHREDSMNVGNDSFGTT